MSSLKDLFNVTVFLYNDNEWNTKIKSTYMYLTVSIFSATHAPRLGLPRVMEVARWQQQPILWRLVAGHLWW